MASVNRRMSGLLAANVEMSFSPRRYIAGEKETERKWGGPVSFSMTTEKKNLNQKEIYNKYLPIFSWV